jgi:hypothetical protein
VSSGAVGEGDVDVDALLQAHGQRAVAFEHIEPHLEGIRSPRLRAETAEWCANQLDVSEVKADVLRAALDALAQWKVGRDVL